ncbi:MAG: hypothetical protein U0441_32610 [Polyangiaceae bacterium]
MDVAKLIRIGSWMILGSITLCGVGCGLSSDESEEGEEVGQAQQAESPKNGMSRRAVSYNDAGRGTLSQNALTVANLSSSSLSTAGLGLQVIKYAIRCALPDNTCFDIATTATDTDVPPECANGVCHFCGDVSIATSWQSGALTVSQEKWVSACMLSLVNYDEQSVVVSVRDSVSGGIPDVKPPESNNYDAPEAAFWGNIFRPNADGTYSKYVCNGGASITPPGRVCGLNANGAVDCSMTFVGSCLGRNITDTGTTPSGTIACDVVDALPNGAVRQCHDSSGVAWDEVVTAYDHALCGDNLCSGHETLGNCPADCTLRPNQY